MRTLGTWLLLLAASAVAGEIVLHEPQTVDGLVAVHISYRPAEGESATGIQFDLNYNSAQFEVSDLVAGDAPEAAGMTTYSGEPGVDMVRVLSAGMGETALGEGSVATVYLRPLSVGADPLSITAGGFVLSDAGGNLLPTQFVDFERPSPAIEETEPADNGQNGALELDDLSLGMQRLAELLGLRGRGATGDSASASSAGSKSASDGTSSTPRLAAGGAPGVADEAYAPPGSSSASSRRSGWRSNRISEGTSSRRPLSYSGSTGGHRITQVGIRRRDSGAGLRSAQGTAKDVPETEDRGSGRSSQNANLARAQSRASLARTQAAALPSTGMDKGPCGTLVSPHDGKAADTASGAQTRACLTGLAVAGMGAALLSLLAVVWARWMPLLAAPSKKVRDS